MLSMVSNELGLGYEPLPWIAIHRSFFVLCFSTSLSVRIGTSTSDFQLAFSSLRSEDAAIGLVLVC